MKDAKDVKVTKIEIQLTDETIKLSVGDAKKLFEGLEELFGKKQIEHVYHDYWWYRPYYHQQYIGGGSRIVYCGSSSNLGTVQGGLQSTEMDMTATASNGVSFKASGETLLCSLAG